MSDLRKKLASLRRTAGVPEIKITGYQAYKGINMLFLADCDDPTFAQKISNNDLTREERATLVEDVAAYFDDTVRKDDNLFEYGIAQIIIDAMDGNFSLPKRFINDNFLQKCLQKKQKSDVKVFNKTKFRNFPLSEKIHIVNDPYDFFMFVWGDTFKANNTDIRNLIVLNGMPMDDIGDEKDASKKSKLRIASIIKRNREKTASNKDNFVILDDYNSQYESRDEILEIGQKEHIYDPQGDEWEKDKDIINLVCDYMINQIKSGKDWIQTSLFMEGYSTAEDASPEDDAELAKEIGISVNEYKKIKTKAENDGEDEEEWLYPLLRDAVARNWEELRQQILDGKYMLEEVIGVGLEDVK